MLNLQFAGNGRASRWPAAFVSIILARDRLSGVHLQRTTGREAFEAGCRGFLLIDCRIRGAALAIKKAAAVITSLRAGQSRHGGQYVKPLREAAETGGLMTQRERELARLLADGYSTKRGGRRAEYQRETPRRTAPRS